MFKRIARDFFILFGIAALWCSTSRTFMQYIWDTRDGVKWWSTYPMKHGDLVSMSYLDFVPRFNPPIDHSPFKHPDYYGAKKTVVYLHGDSYTWPLADSNLAGVAKYYWINRYSGGYFKIDSAMRNILIIEITERMFRDYFNTPRMVDEVKDSVEIPKVSSVFTGARDVQYASIIPHLSVDSFFNKNINQNLQCNLFNYNFVIPIFEYKAALNYYLFNRASGDVVISNDRQFLFLKETVTKNDISSSYNPLAADEVQRLVDNLNKAYAYFKAKGFAEVYLSIIPNSATIMQPEGYNQLIPLVQHHPDLKMKYIDVYSAFQAAPEGLYLPGDTHWTKKGFERWVALVNEKLTGSL